MSIAWTDSETGARGYLVIDTLIRGIAGGGLRMRPGCTVEEVTDLARAMSLKEAMAFQPGSRYLPLGGAKGGIDFDPADPRATEVLRRYLEAMLPLLQSRWAAGEDLGIQQGELDELAAELGLESTVDAALPFVPDGADRGLARLSAAFAARERGVGLGELVGGYGVAQAAIAALRQLRRDPEGATAVVQGFGSMGGASARYLTDAGLRVIGVADAAGLVVNEHGLDVEQLLATRRAHGAIDRAALGEGDRERPREEWNLIPADLVVPAATSYVIDERVAGSLGAALVVEAANVATLREAETLLAARRIPVVPDIIANLATNAWWWWTLFGDVEPTPEAAFARISKTMDSLVSECFERTQDGHPLRDAALAMAGDRARAAAAQPAEQGARG
jgi:glutamate dehydrogenase (NAD(P)+)